MSSCLDLRKFQDNADVEDAFSKLVSGGKAGYKTVIEKDKAPKVCPKCNSLLTGDEKFCPECGNKIERKD
ncbi:hypothetical protein COV15_00590 [Candidatus Woesearchaeota archaeon CG10_big_fil_rev_8_21_14_0_10_34_12]|nr:MAG: hypothetical protein COV15_00590 [Candidatus Woesearchaeota archaeon CG10_big_fil_rev_8_21_14_0_10_34_12]